MTPNAWLMAERQREIAARTADGCCGTPRAPKAPRVALHLRLPRLTLGRPMTPAPCC